MRLDIYHPTALPVRTPRPATAPVEPAPTAASAPAPALPAASTQRVDGMGAAGEYIPARRETTQPVYGPVNQALSSYQSMAQMTDVDTDGVFGIDLFV